MNRRRRELTGKPTIILCNLIARWLVLIEIMFSIKPTDRLNITIQSDGGAEGWEEGGGLKFLCRMSSCVLRYRASDRWTRTGWLPGKARSNKATLELGRSLVDVAAPGGEMPVR